jgi:hypothetical protein
MFKELKKNMTMLQQIGTRESQKEKDTKEPNKNSGVEKYNN